MRPYLAKPKHSLSPSEEEKYLQVQHGYNFQTELPDIVLAIVHKLFFFL